MDLADMMNTVGRLAAPLTQPPISNSQADVLQVAVALMAAAEEILRHLGGRDLAAAQFYFCADRIATSAT